MANGRTYARGDGTRSRREKSRAGAARRAVADSAIDCTGGAAVVAAQHCPMQVQHWCESDAGDGSRSTTGSTADDECAVPATGAACAACAEASAATRTFAVSCVCSVSPCLPCADAPGSAPCIAHAMIPAGSVSAVVNQSPQRASKARYQPGRCMILEYAPGATDRKGRITYTICGIPCRRATAPRRYLNSFDSTVASSRTVISWFHARRSRRYAGE